MGHHAVELDAPESREGAGELRQVIEPDPEPAHSRVNFEMEIDDAAQRAGARVQLLGLVEAVDRRGQIASDQVVGLPAPEPAEAKYRSSDSSPAQIASLLHQRHAEPVGVELLERAAASDCAKAGVVRCDQGDQA